MNVEIKFTILRYTSKSGPSGHSVIDWGGGDNEEGKAPERRLLSGHFGLCGPLERAKTI